jgi:sugar/nucleoside kinase (ribokinase family)
VTAYERATPGEQRETGASDCLPPDYLLIGHVSQDLTPAGVVPGGTVVYAGQTAVALDCQTAVLTSAAADFSLEPVLPGMAVALVESAQTTVFTNIYAADGRRQIVHSVAERLTANHVPATWLQASIVHLAPIANEIDPDVIHLFSHSLVGLTPQGWLRQWGADGRVRQVEWPAAREVLGLATAVVVSEEDLPGPDLEQYRQWSRLLVVTRGSAGCTVHYQAESRHISAPAVAEVNATGAGDIFAAAFFIRLHQTGGDPWLAAEFANALAAQSVTQPDPAAKAKWLSKCR